MSTSTTKTASFSGSKTKGFLYLLCFALAVCVFLSAGSEHAEMMLGVGLSKMWSSPKSAVLVFLFISPCVIFVTTTIAYYRYVVEYADGIAGWSFAGFLGALICCVRLLETRPEDWAGHLAWVYYLFLSYVVWDAVMLLVFLPNKSGDDRAKEDAQEIWNLTSTINWPTLGGLLMIWGAAQHFVAQKADPAVVSNYVDGVIAFHLIFASLVAAIKMSGVTVVVLLRIIGRAFNRLFFWLRDFVLPKKSPTGQNKPPDGTPQGDGAMPETRVEGAGGHDLGADLSGR